MAINNWNVPSGTIDELSRRKLEAFARIEEDFFASFSFTQEVHGQRRFTAFPIAFTVRYLRALYICERKDRLLSVLKTIERYEGERCLELLRGWQEGHTADVVAFMHRKLDNQPYAEVSKQIEEAERMGDLPRARRLTSGRMVLLNRNITLSYALDAIFSLEPARLRDEVHVACAQAGQTPDVIERELVELHSDVYAYAPSPSLARRNMLLMNSLGQRITRSHGDQPGERTDRVRPPESPAPPYAEETIRREMTLISLHWTGRRLLDHVTGALEGGSLTPPDIAQSASDSVADV